MVFKGAIYGKAADSGIARDCRPPGGREFEGPVVGIPYWEHLAARRTPFEKPGAVSPRRVRGGAEHGVVGAGPSLRDCGRHLWQVKRCRPRAYSTARSRLG